MNAVLQDLFGHQRWADAEHWRAIEAHAPARDDDAIRRRLHHLHLVQRRFMWAVADQTLPFAFTKYEEFTTFEDLKSYAHESHALIDRTLPTIAERLEDRISMPSFGDPPLTISVSEALLQCVMHSQWHRGQNATRLRELGATPPTVDLILWYWKGRPPAFWIANH